MAIFIVCEIVIVGLVLTVAMIFLIVDFDYDRMNWEIEIGELSDRRGICRNLFPSCVPDSGTHEGNGESGEEH